MKLESLMNYLMLEILEDENFKPENGKRMIEAWLTAKKKFEQMNSGQIEKLYNKIKNERESRRSQS